MEQYFLTQVASMTGKETESAERVRLYRDRKKQLTLQCNGDVTKCNDNKEKQRTENKEEKQEQKVLEEDISLQIKNLRQRYDDIELKIIDTYFDILKWTRKNGKIADSVILKIYQEWEKFSKSKVLYTLNLYVSNPKFHDKKENYCYGIMRNSTAEEVNKNQKPEGNMNTCRRSLWKKYKRHCCR